MRAEEARLASEGVAQLERRLQELRHEGKRDLAELKARLDAREEELERSRADAGERLEAQDRDLRELRQSLTEGEQRLGELRREVEEKSRAVEERSRAVSAARDELASARSKLADASENLAAREAELDTVEAKLGDRDRELAAAAALVEAQGKELGETRRDIAERTDRLNAVQHELDAVRGELAETRARLEARERHLQTAQSEVESRDRRLAAAERELESREGERERLRAAIADRDRAIELAEARLEKSRQQLEASRARAERFKGSLVALREGRSYRLMRVLWRLRHPFRRAPRQPATIPAPVEGGSEGDGERPPGQTEGRLRVASILDEMSEACFAPECDLVPLSLEGWREQLEQQPPDLLLVESAWNGNGGEWQYRVAKYPRKDLVGLPALRELVDACRERGIPTAFWNKEDPVHFERFAEAASLFDHVFTTDARCVERYRELPGERTVTPLPFAAQPRIHNPAAVVPERSSSPCFAGAWYRDRHPERRKALEAVLDAARPYGLVIYDRRFGTDDEAFGFPERFAPHVLGRLPYDRVLDVYKSHSVFLNANSVIDSPTMCSRRVLELAACDTAILSTPAAALRSLLGDGAVAEAADEPSAAEDLRRLLDDVPARARRVRAARRRVFAEHTYADRLATIAEVAGLGAARPDPMRSWELALRPGIDLGAPAMVDLRAAATFADADIIGAARGNGGAPPEHRPVQALDPRVLLVRRDFLDARGPLPEDPAQIEAKLREWSDAGARLYAADADLVDTTG